MEWLLVYWDSALLRYLLLFAVLWLCMQSFYAARARLPWIIYCTVHGCSIWSKLITDSIYIFVGIVPIDTCMCCIFAVSFINYAVNYVLPFKRKLNKLFHISFFICPICYSSSTQLFPVISPWIIKTKSCNIFSEASYTYKRTWWYCTSLVAVGYTPPTSLFPVPKMCLVW